MNRLIDLLGPAADAPGRAAGREWSLVVVVGAGPSMHTLDALRADRIVLVEGDPQSAAELQASALGLGVAVEIVVEPVVPTAGPLTWHRYNLRSLNGPVRWEPSTSGVPRLRTVGSLKLSGRLFADLLRSALPPGTDGDASAAQRRLLVLDVPGQTSLLLGAVPDDVLHRYGRVLVLGSAEMSATVGLAGPLAGRHYARHDAGLTGPARRGVALFVLDVEAADRQSRIDGLTSLVDDLQAQLEAQRQTIAEHARTVRRVSDERDEQAVRATARRGRVDDLEARLAAAQAELAERDRRLAEASRQLGLAERQLEAVESLVRIGLP